MRMKKNLPQHFTLSLNALGQLTFTDHLGASSENVYPVRAFPISAPDDGFSIMSRDGHELVWINSLSQLEQSQQSLIKAELARRDLMPEILQILRVSSFATPSIWDIKTNKGEAQLTLQGEDQIWRTHGGKLLITDKFGLNFLISDIAKLDRHSRKILDRFL